MAKLQVQTNPEVSSVLNSYPDLVQEKLLHLRRLILEAASEIEGITCLEETLKWGEPSYLVNHGSTIRIDWKEKKPNQYAMYFSCTSKLVSTFKLIYKDKFNFEGNRAIVFHMNDELRETDLKACITTALTYHKVKDVPLLGL